MAWTIWSIRLHINKNETSIRHKRHCKDIRLFSVKVRKYIEFNFLEKFKVGHKVMITTESIQRLIDHNKITN